MTTLDKALPFSAGVAAIKAIWPFSRAPRIERYDVRVRYEWAIIYVDEQAGAFTCQSSFGTYAYIWRAIGDRTLKQFLAGLDFDYFMGKTRPGYKCFDPDRTVEVIKELIVRARREQAIDKDVARDAWRDLDYCERDNAPVFMRDFCASEALIEVVGGDYYDLCCESADGNARGFWETIWPEFLRQTARAHR